MRLSLNLAVVLLFSFSATAFAFQGIANWAKGINSFGSRILGGNSLDYVSSLAFDDNGDLRAAGSFGNTTSNGDKAYDFQGTVLVGKSGGASSSDAWVAKVNSNGAQLWIKTLGGSGSDAAIVAQGPGTSNFYVGGTYTNTSTDTKVVTDFAGNTLIGKTTTSSAEVFVAQLDANGAQQWIRTLGGKGVEGISSVFSDSSGNVYVAGNYTNNNANTQSVTDFSGATLLGKTATAFSNAFIAKLNSAGTQQWIKTLGGSGGDYARAIYVDSGGNIYVTGSFNNSTLNAKTATDFAGNGLLGVTSTASADVFVTKLNSAGTQLWIKTMGGTFSGDGGYGIISDTSGNVYVSGIFTNDSGNTSAVKDFSGATLSGLTTTNTNNVFAVCLNSSGTQLWIKSLGGKGGDQVGGIAIDALGYVYLAGTFRNDSFNTDAVKDFTGTAAPGKSNTTSFDAFVAKLDSSGIQQWLRVLGGTGYDSADSAAIDGTGNVYVGGKVTNTRNNASLVSDFSGLQMLGRSDTVGTADAYILKMGP